MLAYFKKRVSKNITTTIIVCAILIVIAMCVSKFNFIKYITGPTKADMSTSMSKLEGKYVTFDIDYVWANYIRTSTQRTKNGVNVGSPTLTSLGYIVIVADRSESQDALPHYFGIVVPAKNEKTLNNLCDQFWDYLYDGDTMPAPYHFTGSVRKIKSGEMKYWNDMVSKVNKDTGYDQYFDMTYLEAYTVDYDMIGSSSKFLVIICFWGMVVVLLYAIIHVIVAMLSYAAPVKKFIANTPGQSMEKLDASFANASKVSADLFVSADYVFYRKGGKVHVIDLHDVVWTYVYTYKGTNYLRMYGVNGKMIAAPAVPAAAAAVKEIAQVAPHCVCGYSADLNKMFSKDLNAFLGLKYYPARQAQRDQAPSGVSFEMDVDGTLRPINTQSEAQPAEAEPMQPIYTPGSDDLEKELAAMMAGNSDAAAETAQAAETSAAQAAEAVQNTAEAVQNAAEDIEKKEKNPYDLDFTSIDTDLDIK